MTSFRETAARLIRTAGVALLALCVGCAAQKARAKANASSSDSPDVRPANRVETFDAAWRIIYESHFDTNFNGVDWRAVRAELGPKAEAARSVADLRGVIQEMLGRLGQSHMSLIPSALADALDPKKVRRFAESNNRSAHDPNPGDGTKTAAPEEEDEEESAGGEDGEVGFDVRLIDRQIVVNRVDPDGPAHGAGVQRGWVVESIGGHRMSDGLEKLSPDLEPQNARFMAWRLAKALLMGKPGTSVRIDFLNDTDQPVTLDLARQLAKGVVSKLGYLPPLRAHLERERLESESGATVGLIRLNLFMIPVAGLFDKAVDEFRGADGIVIDLRGNLGGIGGMVMGLAGHFLREPVSLGTMKMRGNELKFFANPRWVNPAGQRVDPFAGPVAILVDSTSLSAAEIFAGGLQDLRRVRVFGETSPGQALPAVWDRLPNGDVLYHAFADFVTGSGVRLEGRGVIPDEVCPVTRKDLLAGRDAPLLAAMKWISDQKRKNAHE